MNLVNIYAKAQKRVLFQSSQSDYLPEDHQLVWQLGGQWSAEDTARHSVQITNWLREFAVFHLKLYSGFIA